VRVTREEWTEEDAEKAMAAALLGRDVPRPVERPSMTFGQAIEKYLAVKESEGKRSIRDDRQNLGRLCAAFSKETPLEAITASLVSDYKVARMKTTVGTGDQERPIGPATLNRELASLRHLLRLAVEEWQVLAALPRIKLLKEPEGRLRFLSEDEIARLLEASRRSLNAQLTAIVAVAVNTGMRLGELMRLRWEDVDFSRGVVLLRHTKSGKRREIPMNDAVDAALNALAGAKVEGPVFRKASGERWGSIRTAWDNACRAAKLEDVHFHDVRHTFASHMMMRGASLGDLRDLLGHADIKMTMRYAHLSPAHRRAAVDKLVGLTPVPSAHDQHMVESKTIVPA
jgi:integrase